MLMYNSQCEQDPLGRRGMLVAVSSRAVFLWLNSIAKYNTSQHGGLLLGSGHDYEADFQRISYLLASPPPRRSYRLVLPKQTNLIMV